MPFALAASTITQTGTDTDLSGLSAIAGVTTETSGPLTVYNVGGLLLRVEGDLTMDPDIEKILFGAPAVGSHFLNIRGGASMTIGKEIPLNGFTRYSTGVAMYMDDTSLGFIDRITLKGGATLNWYGGEINMHSGLFNIDNTAVFNIHSQNARFIYRTSNTSNQIRQSTSTSTITGFTFIGGDYTNIRPGIEFSGYRPVHCTGSIAFSSAFDSTTDFEVLDYAGQGNTADIKHWSGSRTVIRNSLTGTELNAGPHIINNVDSFGTTRVYQDLNVNISEFGGGPILGAKLYFSDYDSGNRKLYDMEAPNIDLTGDMVYQSTSDAAGDFAQVQVLTGAVIGDDSYGAVNDPINVGKWSWDYRSKNSDTTDLFDVSLIAYGFALTTVPDIPLRGNGGTSIKATTVSDINITEASDAVVSAYTSIDNTAELYDRSKIFLVDNFTGETSLIVQRTDDLIDLGSLNLVVDGTAAQAYAFDGTTITIKTDTFYVGDLLSTGTITAVNGASIVGAILDSNGDSFLSFAGLDSWEVFSDAALTTSLGSGLVTDNFRFNFVASTVYYVQLSIITTGGVQLILQQITPAAAGETAVDLTTQALLLALTNNVDDVCTKTETARDHARAANKQTQGP